MQPGPPGRQGPLLPLAARTPQRPTPTVSQQPGPNMPSVQWTSPWAAQSYLAAWQRLPAATVPASARCLRHRRSSPVHRETRTRRPSLPRTVKPPLPSSMTISGVTTRTAPSTAPATPTTPAPAAPETAQPARMPPRLLPALTRLRPVLKHRQPALAHCQRTLKPHLPPSPPRPRRPRPSPAPPTPPPRSAPPLPMTSSPRWTAACSPVRIRSTCRPTSVSTASPVQTVPRAMQT